VPHWTCAEIHTGIINMDVNVFSVQFVCVFSLHFSKNSNIVKYNVLSTRTVLFSKMF